MFYHTINSTKFLINVVVTPSQAIQSSRIKKCPENIFHITRKKHTL